MPFTSEIKSSVDYLGSEEAQKSLEADAYWPKWHSPWWHMLLLHEMGETKRIPKKTIRWFIDSLNRVPLKIFPIHPGELPEGVDPYRGSPCHCQLGNVYQVLAASGVEVDQELPWIRPWLLRYQMTDGGMNCDSEAYLVKGECPSSMVGTISAFEAILLCTPRPYTPEEDNFIEKATQFLIERKLINGSSSKHNASEREEAKDWVKPCFPRFYLYDVLRGLNALTFWAEKKGKALPAEAIKEAVGQMQKKFPDGAVKNERYSYIGVGSFFAISPSEWKYQKPASQFALLDRVSAIGETSPYLSKQWAQIQTRV